MPVSASKSHMYLGQNLAPDYDWARGIWSGGNIKFITNYEAAASARLRQWKSLSYLKKYISHL